MLKIALNAGHYLYTAGKRCLKSLDKNETREWTLNDRICDKVEKKLTAYTDYVVILYLYHGHFPQNRPPNMDYTMMFQVKTSCPL